MKLKFILLSLLFMMSQSFANTQYQSVTKEAVAFLSSHGSNTVTLKLKSGNIYTFRLLGVQSHLGVTGKRDAAYISQKLMGAKRIWVTFRQDVYDGSLLRDSYGRVWASLSYVPGLKVNSLNNELKARHMSHTYYHKKMKPRPRQIAMTMKKKTFSKPVTDVVEIRSKSYTSSPMRTPVNVPKAMTRDTNPDSYSVGSIPGAGPETEVIPDSDITPIPTN